MNNILTRYGVKIDLTNERTANYQTELIVSPKQSDYQLYPVRYKLFLRTKNFLYVPRFYYKQKCNITTWPSIELTKRIKPIDVKFEGSLRESCRFS